MKASVLIPSYRRGPALLDGLEGLINGERLPDQVVVVLRDTDEESQRLVSDWLSECPHADIFEVADVSEPGQIAAMNRGLEVVDGDIVAFTDDDAVPRSDWLRRIVAHYDDPEVGGVGGRDCIHPQKEGRYGQVRAVGQITWFGRIIGKHHLELNGPPTEVDHLKGVNMSFRRRLIRPFDENILGPHFNDTDQSLSVRSAGYSLIYDPQAVVDHYPAPRPDSVAGRDLFDPRQVYLDAHDHAYILRKHLPPWRAAAWLPYLTLVGSRQVPGLGMLLYHALTGTPTAYRQFGANLRGVFDAVTGRYVDEDRICG